MIHEGQIGCLLSVVDWPGRNMLTTSFYHTVFIRQYVSYSEFQALNESSIQTAHSSCRTALTVEIVWTV